MDQFFNATHLLHPGIYVLRLKGTVMYVGQSINPLSRIGNHQRRITFDEVLFLRCSKEELDTTEQRLIRELKPKLNVARQRPYAKRGNPFPTMLVNPDNPAKVNYQRFKKDEPIGAQLVLSVGGIRVPLRKKGLETPTRIERRV